MRIALAVSNIAIYKNDPWWYADTDEYDDGITEKEGVYFNRDIEVQLENDKYSVQDMEKDYST